MPLLPVMPCTWNLSPLEARAVQAEVARRVVLAPLQGPLRYVAGADTSYNLGSNRVSGAVVVWDVAAQKVVEARTAVVDTPFPYVPGLLTFREAPALMPAFAALRIRPDLLMFNGHGIAHPRRIGLASHLGVVLGLPSVGVAQKKLVGEHGPVGERAGSHVPLVFRGQRVGVVVRTRPKCNPIYISPGHGVTVNDALGAVLATTLGYKLPAPVREAHRLCNDVRRETADDRALESRR